MAPASAVFQVVASSDEAAPAIDFERQENSTNSWLAIDDMIRGNMATDQAILRRTKVLVDAPQGDACDMFPVSGTTGLFSERAVEVFGNALSDYAELLQITVNDKPYFFLKPTNRLPCLDRERSIVVPFPSDPKSVMKIKKYVFDKSRIHDPVVFFIPEVPYLFCTETIIQRSKAACLRWICFDPVDR